MIMEKYGDNVERSVKIRREKETPAQKQEKKEKIDVRKMIIYSELMHPKFDE